MIRTYQGSFAGGEISPSLLGHTQFAKYAVAARQIENMTVEPFGGVANRPGMYFLGVTKNDAIARLIKFEYSAELQYLLEFGDYYVRVWHDGAPVADIESPYSKYDIWDIKFTQSAAYMFICCGGMKPQTLICRSRAQWEFAPFNAKLGPFRAWNTEDIRVRTNILTGKDAILESDAPLFQDLLAGQLIKLRHYVPMKSIGWNLTPFDPIPPQPVNLGFDSLGVEYDKVLIEEFEERNVGNVTLKTSGWWVGAVRCLISWAHKTNADDKGQVDITIGGVNDGRQEEANYYIEWANNKDYKTKITVRTVGRVFVAGKKDNQFIVEVSSPSKYASKTFPTEPMEETDNPNKLGTGSVLMPWTTVKGSWSLVTSGIWKGEITLYRRIDPNYDAGVVIAQKGSEYNSNANFAGAEIDDGVQYKLMVSGSEPLTVEKSGLHSFDWRFSYGDLVETGIAEITEIRDDFEAIADVKQQFGSVEYTADWAAGAWHDGKVNADSKGNYPKVCMYYQDRLVFANTDSEPQTVWASRIGDYENFGTSDPLSDDDAVNVTLAGASVNEIRALVPAADLILMTNSTEFILRGDSTITPLSVSARPQSFRGSGKVDPVIVGNSVVFISNDGRTARDFSYALQSDGYDGQDRSILARHIFERTEIVAMAYQQEPWSVMWFLGMDGTLASMTYIKEHDVWAWARHYTDGNILDICCVGNLLYLLVKRESDTAGPLPPEYFIEYIGEREDIFLDSALVYDSPGVPVTKVWGLDHLIGREVSVVGDGFYLGKRVVDSAGAINLIDPKSHAPYGQTGSGRPQAAPTGYTKVIAGLPYRSLLRTMPVNIDTPSGSSVGVKKKISALTVVVSESRGFLAGDSLDRLIECDKRDVNDPLGTSQDPWSGKVYTLLNSSSGDDGGVYFVQDRPLPLEILGVEKNVEI